MSLENQISDYKISFRKRVPQDIQNTMAQATQTLIDADITSDAPKSGDTLPVFNLPNHNGKQQSLDSLLKQGPVVITFYRGGWCPFCNLELAAYQKILPDIEALGATLIAITPEVPDASLSTVEKNALTFEVLSDIDAKYARELRLVFSLPEQLRPLYASFGIQLEKHNGSNVFDLPLAATFVVAQDGTVASAFVNADYTQRQEPSEVVRVLKSLDVSD